MGDPCTSVFVALTGSGRYDILIAILAQHDELESIARVMRAHGVSRVRFSPEGTVAEVVMAPDVGEIDVGLESGPTPQDLAAARMLARAREAQS